MPETLKLPVLGESDTMQFGCGHTDARLGGVGPYSGPVSHLSSSPRAQVCPGPNLCLPAISTEALVARPSRLPCLRNPIFRHFWELTYTSPAVFSSPACTTHRHLCTDQRGDREGVCPLRGMSRTPGDVSANRVDGSLSAGCPRWRLAS